MSIHQISVLCVDDHTVVREALVALINRHRGFKVVGAAATGEDAIKLFRVHKPDVTLLDLHLPDLNGLDVMRVIRGEDPEARFVVLTMYHGEEDIRRGLQAGAAAYLLKDVSFEDLIRTLSEVHAGERPIRAEILAQLNKRAGHASLTPREIELVELISHGLRNREIGKRLSITEETVEVHLKNIFAKLDVHDRTAAVRVAITRGIIHIS